MNPLAIPGTILLLLTHFFSATAKRGLAFNNPSTHIRSFGGAGNQVNWAYKCDSARDDGTLGGVMYVPMLWSAGAEYTKNGSTQRDNSHAILGSGITQSITAAQ
ncbi:unnamed protein product [Diplocarpon coronariae]|nr:hypothetical protein JHW43_000040 [Diplocarpon mali]